MRPLLPKELEEKHSSEHISYENALDKGIEITREDKKDEKAEFQFDAVFKPDSTQIQIFGEGNFLLFLDCSFLNSNFSKPARAKLARRLQRDNFRVWSNRLWKDVFDGRTRRRLRE